MVTLSSYHGPSLFLMRSRLRPISFPVLHVSLISFPGNVEEKNTQPKFSLKARLNAV